MKDRKTRSKAYVFSQAFKREFREVEDGQGEKLFELVRIMLQIDELSLRKVLNTTLIFVKEEAKHKPSLN